MRVAGTEHRACHCCGLVQEVPPLPERHVARCRRCGTTIWNPEATFRGNRLAFAAALGGLVLYPLAVSLPIVSLERFGHRTQASVWDGGLGLLQKGEIVVGLVVLVASLVLPLAKLLGLLAITGFSRWSRRHRALTYRVIEWTGRWGMLDVLLLAILVAWLKIGDLVRVEAGPAAAAFAGCVVLSLVASAAFDPHALWHEEPEVSV